MKWFSTILLLALILVLSTSPVQSETPSSGDDGAVVRCVNGRVVKDKVATPAQVNTPAAPSRPPT